MRDFLLIKQERHPRNSRVPWGDHDYMLVDHAPNVIGEQQLFLAQTLRSISGTKVDSKLQDTAALIFKCREDRYVDSGRKFAGHEWLDQHVDQRDCHRSFLLWDFPANKQRVRTSKWFAPPQVVQRMPRKEWSRAMEADLLLREVDETVSARLTLEGKKMRLLKLAVDDATTWALLEALLIKAHVQSRLIDALRRKEREQ